MAEERTWWESIKVEGGELLEKVKILIREGNVRRIVIRQGDRSVAEFPLTVGVVGTVAAPILAAVGALAALLTNCTIEVQRAVLVTPAEPPSAPPVGGPGRAPRSGTLSRVLARSAFGAGLDAHQGPAHRVEVPQVGGQRTPGRRRHPGVAESHARHDARPARPGG